MFPQCHPQGVDFKIKLRIKIKIAYFGGGGGDFEINLMDLGEGGEGIYQHKPDPPLLKCMY